MIGILIVCGVLLIGYEFIREVGEYAEEINPCNKDCGTDFDETIQSKGCGRCMGASFGDCERCKK